MPKNILVDLNVIIDALLERPGYQAAQTVLDSSVSRNTALYISAHMHTTLAYLLESAKLSQADIRSQLQWVLQKFEIVPVDSKLLTAALKSDISDYEDAVVEQAAVRCQAAVIVTGNVKDFKRSVVRAVTPEEHLQELL